MIPKKHGHRFEFPGGVSAWVRMGVYTALHILFFELFFSREGVDDHADPCKRPRVAISSRECRLGR